MQRKGFNINKHFRGRTFTNRIMSSTCETERFDYNLKYRTVDLGATFKKKSHQLKDHIVYNQVSTNQNTLKTRLKNALHGLPKA